MQQEDVHTKLLVVCFASVSVKLRGGKARLIDSLCFLPREERCLNHTVSMKNLCDAYTTDRGEVCPGIRVTGQVYYNECCKPS